MGLNLKEAVSDLKNGETLELQTKEGDYEVGPAENFVGGGGSDGYISEVLGNVVYVDAKEVLDKSIGFLKGEGLKVTIELA